MKFSPG